MARGNIVKVISDRVFGFHWAGARPTPAQGGLLPSHRYARHDLRAIVSSAAHRLRGGTGPAARES